VIFDATITSILVKGGLALGLANGVAFPFAVTLNFYLNLKFTFKSWYTKQRFYLWIFIALLERLLNTALLYIIQDLLISTFQAKILASLVQSPLSFVSSQLVLKAKVAGLQKEKR